MIQISNDQLEKIIGENIKKNWKVLGVDTASRTGWATVDINSNYCNIDYGIIDIDSKDKFFKYDYMIDFWGKFFEKFSPNMVVIEDAFLFRNVNTTKELTRYGMIVYNMAYLNSSFIHNDRLIIGPAEARKRIGLKNAKKEIVHEEFKEKFGIDINEDNVVDAIILALNGVIAWQKKEVKKVPKRKKSRKT